MSAEYDAIVIGAGANGLAFAARLAHASRGRRRRVLVVERRDRPGGLAELLGETTLLRPMVVEGLDLEAHGLDLVEPAHVFVPEPAGEGEGFTLDGTLEAEALARWSGFLDRAGRSLAAWVDRPPPALDGGRAVGLLEIARAAMNLRRIGRADAAELLRVAPMCVADWLNEHFTSDRLKAALALPAVAGSFAGPWSPGTAANLLHRAALEARPVREVRGGAAALIAALVSSAEAAGVEIRTRAEVRAILVERGGRAGAEQGEAVTGIELAGGETLRAGIVAASCDPKHTLVDLLPPGSLQPKLAQRIACVRMRGTTARASLVLREPLRFACRPDLAIERARIVETLDGLEQAFDPVKYRTFAERPALELRTSQGGRRVEIDVHFAPYDEESGWSERARTRLADAVVATLARYAPGVTRSIESREIVTPLDIERVFGATGGHLHHGEHALDQLIVRPAPECARYATPFRGLYLCGSGAHPGGNLTCAPGWLAAGVVK